MFHDRFHWSSSSFHYDALVKWPFFPQCDCFRFTEWWVVFISAASTFWVSTRCFGFLVSSDHAVNSSGGRFGLDMHRALRRTRLWKQYPHPSWRLGLALQVIFAAVFRHFFHTLIIIDPEAFPGGFRRRCSVCVALPGMSQHPRLPCASDCEI